MPLILLGVSIVLLLVLIVVFKWNPFLALVVASFAVGLANGMPAQAALNSILKGIGDTMGSIVLIIVAGAILGKLIEESGAALAPLLAGLIATSSSLHNAILIICVSAWVLCSIFFAVTAYLVPRDIDTLRGQMRQRAERETSNLAPSLRSGQALSEAEGVKRD